MADERDDTLTEGMKMLRENNVLASPGAIDLLDTIAETMKKSLVEDVISMPLGD